MAKAKTEREQDLENAQGFIGHPIKDAQAHAKHHGWSIRVTQQDGHACIATRDFRTDRINVATVDGVITEIRGIG